MVSFIIKPPIIYLIVTPKAYNIRNPTGLNNITDKTIHQFLN
jgi:hypothetical protein